jgi:hypothetical protein
MPALPAVPQVLRVQFHWTIGEDTTTATTLHMHYTGTAPNAAACSGLALALGNAMDTMTALTMLNTYSMTAVRVTDLTAAAAGDATSAFSTAGGKSGTMIAAGACALANYQIGRRYRGGKPRSYWPFGWAEEMADPQKWGATFINTCDTALNSFVSTAKGTTVSGTTIDQLVSVSYFSGFHVVTDPVTGRARNVPTLRSGGPAVDDVISQTFNPRIAYQRRRSVR